MRAAAFCNWNKIGGKDVYISWPAACLRPLDCTIDWTTGGAGLHCRRGVSSSTQVVGPTQHTGRGRGSVFFGGDKATGCVAYD